MKFQPKYHLTYMKKLKIIKIVYNYKKFMNVNNFFN